MTGYVPGLAELPERLDEDLWLVKFTAIFHQVSALYG